MTQVLKHKPDSRVKNDYSDRLLEQIDRLRQKYLNAPSAERSTMLPWTLWSNHYWT